MNANMVYKILSEMSEKLSVNQMKRLQEVLLSEFKDGCVKIRDLAIIELLVSTIIRVGELVNLKICDIDFNERECIVHGKGDKEQKAYFDAKTKLYLQEYLEQRRDEEEWLFASL